MMIREAIFAGRFYDASQQQCVAAIEACVRRAAQPADATDSTARILGGVVPHAGWNYSGHIVARVIQTAAARARPHVVIIFGAIHVLHGNLPSVFPSGAWETPLGLAHVDARLSERLMGQTGLLEGNPHAHENEHSIEVIVPFIQHLLPDVPLVPIMVPINEKAPALGRSVGQTCKSYGVKPLILCSTDLTHYGPGFRFTPRGAGPDGRRWAKEENDRRMVDLMLDMRADDAVKEAVMQQNACGGGAIAATLAACRALGARRGVLLEHAASHEIMPEENTTDSVGYAGIVFE